MAESFHEMKSATASGSAIPIVAAHGLMLITALATVVFVFPWFASEYYNMLGSPPLGFRQVRDLNRFTQNWGVVILPLIPILMWADFRLVKKIKARRDQVLLNYWSLLLTSLFCVFMIWFLYALSSPERYIERHRRQDREKAPGSGLKSMTPTATCCAEYVPRHFGRV